MAARLEHPRVFVSSHLRSIVLDYCIILCIPCGNGTQAGALLYGLHIFGNHLLTVQWPFHLYHRLRHILLWLAMKSNYWTRPSTLKYPSAAATAAGTAGLKLLFAAALLGAAVAAAIPVDAPVAVAETELGPDPDFVVLAAAVAAPPLPQLDSTETTSVGSGRLEQYLSWQLGVIDMLAYRTRKQELNGTYTFNAA